MATSSSSLRQAQDGDVGVVSRAENFGTVTRVYLADADGNEFYVTGDWRPMQAVVEELMGAEVEVRDDDEVGLYLVPV